MSGTGQPSAVTFHQEPGTGKQKDEARGKLSQVRVSALKLEQLVPAEWSRTFVLTENVVGDADVEQVSRLGVMCQLDLLARF